MPYKIAIVDDNRLLVSQLFADLSCSAEVVFTAFDGADYLEQMAALSAEQQPQAVLMDIEMPVMGGIEAVRQSAALYPCVQYIMFTIADDDSKLFEAIKAGAHGYLLKDEYTDVILDAIAEVVEQRGAPMSPSIARKTLKLLSGNTDKQAPACNLSEREAEILKYIVSGLNYKQIAEKVFLSPFTVRNHITKIYSKLHITSKAQAIQLAVSNKWV